MNGWRTAGASVALLWLLAVIAGGCALTDKSTPIRPRYFTPSATPAAAGSSGRAQGAMFLRLQRIRAGSHLKHKAVYRDSAHEISFDEQRRWAELPEDYLRRALSRELFERRGVLRVTSGTAPTLEVELVDFDLIQSDEPHVRVSAVMVLAELGRASLEQTIVTTQPLPEDDADDPQVIADVMGVALNEIVTRIGDRVVRQLVSQARKPSSSRPKPSQSAPSEQPPADPEQ